MGLRRDLLDATLTPCEVPPRPVRLLAGLLGAVVIVWCTWDDSGLGDTSRQWAIPAIVVVSLLLAELLPAARRLLPTPGLLPLLITASALAVYACVPETSDQMPAVFALCLLAVGVELVSRAQLPLLVSLSLALVVLGGGIYGATGRQSALVGALFAMWPLVLTGTAVALRPTFVRSTWPWRWAVAVIGAGAALAVARTGALEDSIEPALRAVAVFGGASLALAIALMLAGSRATHTDVPASVHAPRRGDR